MRTITALATFVALLSGVAYAQARHPWTFEELTAKADCVVIGEVVDTQDKGQTSHPEVTPAYPVIEFDTTFTVRTLLKSCEGVGAGATIHLKHYAPDFDHLGQGVINQGSLLNLPMGSLHLLFLKRVAGAPYEPVSGQTWPSMSVYALANPVER